MEESKQNWIHKALGIKRQQNFARSIGLTECNQSIGERLGQNMKSGGKVTKVRLNAGHT
ncbi:hypothetical protein PPACK8108_LOCUS17917 [Phakopsora pachyrhizi]|uniref:Uncharacterized protein n=1 Tax=Phakopsora pachyrhizi TaxID=170000 RepID=A0AAV0BBK5_PHAPC|nr:hypothetical protein PPACK8108_LOCUS17917 [Phakopsora pachyrhizi]